MENTHEEKKRSWWDFLKIVVVGVIIGVIIPIVSAISGWRMGSIQKDQMETEQRQAEWEQWQKENELAPTIKVDNKGTVLLGRDEYIKCELYNSENNLAGGKLKDLDGVIIIRCGEVRVKSIWIKDAIYKVEVPFDAEEQRAIIFFKSLDTIEKKAVLLKNEIEEGLWEQGETDNYEFEIRIGIVATLEYSDSNNNVKEQRYIVYLGESSYCEVVGGGKVDCDRYYYIKYGKEEQEEEYAAVIYETVERIIKECKGN